MKSTIAMMRLMAIAKSGENQREIRPAISGASET
jgi:hypothetical protein